MTVRRLLVAAIACGVVGFAIPVALSQPAPAQGQSRAAAAPATPGTVAPTDQTGSIRSLGKELTDTVGQSQSDPTIPEIMDALDRNVAAVKRIRQTIDGLGSTGRLTDQQLESVATDFETIAKSFSDIASMAPGVFQRRRAELSDLNAIGNRIGFGMIEASQQIDTLTKRNGAIDQTLKGTGNTTSTIEKLQYEKQVNQTIIRNLQTTITWWQQFATKHGKLMEALDAQSEGLDLFFYVLGQNARLYDSGAKTLRMGRDITVALRDLETMKNAVGSVGEVETRLIQSWGDVSKIMQEVGQQLELRLGPGA